MSDFRQLQETVRLARSQYPDESLELAASLVVAADLCVRFAFFSDAAELLREGISIRERLDSDNWTTFNARSLLGGTLIGLAKMEDSPDVSSQRLSEAETFLLSGYEGMKQREAKIPSESATRIPEALDRLDLQYTPKHGSWLNIAENELSSMTRQAMHGRRFGTLASIEKQLSSWATSTNEKQRGVDCQFTVEDCRTMLKHLYPKIKCG